MVADSAGEVQCPPRPPWCRIRAIRGSRQRGVPTREQCVELAPTVPSTGDRSGRCRRASANTTGSTYLAPHITDLGRTAGDGGQDKCPPHAAAQTFPNTRYRQSRHCQFAIDPDHFINPVTACSAHGHGIDEAVVCLLQHKGRSQTVLKLQALKRSHRWVTARGRQYTVRCGPS